jgi:preprotein translocase subunit SecA
MLKKFVQLFGGDPNQREIDKYSKLVDEINALEAEFENLTDQELSEKTPEFRARLAEGETLDDLMVEAFATVREASKRTIGLRHYDVQLIGGAALHHGKIAEMRTGEGKTLVATLPQYLNALTGRGVHLVTVNDYLARRDARWMAPIYHALGMSVGVLQMAARTENGKKAFIVDFERSSPHEDQHHLRMVLRQEAYAADIIYGTNSEFGFDYLRDNMTNAMDERVQRGHYYAIIDEVDNILIDEARTPLIISGPAQDEAEWYVQMAQVVKALRPEDYEVSEKDRNVTLSEIGEARVEELLATPLRDPDRPEDVTLEQARLLGYLEQALRAQFLFRRNKDYLVQAGKVIIIDEFTGRLMPGRRWSDGLHQAVEAKEGVRVESESVTYATITIQNYFRMYSKLAGMTGTALTEAEEFDKIYKLGVLAIPTNLEYQAMRPESGLVDLEGRDDLGYKYRYYSQRDDLEKLPVFWRRKDYPDVIYRTEEAKLRAIVREILLYNVQGRPLLVGTTSVELSDRLSNRLRAEPLRRLCQVLLLRSHWLEKNNREEDGRQISELQFLNQSLDKLDVGELRKLARDLGISFNTEDPDNLDRLTTLLSVMPDDRNRLVADLQGGIPHQVLNARKHTEESQIIAGAGAFGAVTIATNMAGRGVDIKLGGELAEEVLASVHRVLHRAGHQNIYDMSMGELKRALLELNPEEYGIYESEISFFLQHMQDMDNVRLRGGLHVIGSERHEARRIDNQLRGRAARQGDPGSSRFYLSMEDELMRLFGGQQADSLMQRLKIDDALPLEVGLVGRLVEQSQTRVEGSNFDVRKHLLEYDDVLNAQRAKIYAQRDLIFTKDDLSEDINEMLRMELNRRVPEALEDEGGPWKLLGWLDQIQPSFISGKLVYPSLTVRLLVDSVLDQRTTSISKQGALPALLKIARGSLEAEREHLIATINHLLDQTQERLESQINERMEATDTFFEGLSLEDEEGEARRPADLLTELSSLVRLPIKLSPEAQRQLRNDHDIAIDEVRSQIENTLVSQAISRLVGSVEHRIGESLDLTQNQLSGDDWNALAKQILNAVETIFDNRIIRFLGTSSSVDGQITHELENVMARLPEMLDENTITNLLLLIPQGSRAAFDKKTHRRVMLRTNRLDYTFYAAGFLENLDSEDVTTDVLQHLDGAYDALCQAWGLFEWARLTGVPVSQLDQKIKNRLMDVLDGQLSEETANQSLEIMSNGKKEQVVDQLGRQALTELYRRLLLGVITELWVEYLTQMEALRVSIGLEAYAQRDPLVQYKSRASELFQNLVISMRTGVVSRMFTYRPPDLSSITPSKIRIDSVSTETARAGASEAIADVNSSLGDTRHPPTGGSAVDKSPGKRKRHRRR